MWYGSIFPMFSTFKGCKKLASYKNRIEWQNTFVKWVNVCLNLFEWNGLPDTISERYIEEALLIDGKVALVKDDDLGYLMLRVNPNYIFNIYGQFSKASVYGYNGYNKTFNCYMEGSDNNEAKAVICRDNNLMYPVLMYLMTWTDRLTQAMRGIDVASEQLKHPYFITCEETQVTTVKSILRDITGNELAVIGGKTLDPDAFKILPTNANPAILQQMWDNYYKLENTLRTQLGIKNNSMPNKAERLLVDEVNSDDENRLINIFLRLYQRQLFCEQANKLFGLNISCKLRFEELMNTNERDTDNLQNMETNTQSLAGQ